MHSDDVWWRQTSLFVAAMIVLGGCAHHHLFGAGGGDDDDEGINTYPTNYKTDILGGMHAYLNDPTGIRDAAVSQPMLKQIGDDTRYVACLQANVKLNGGTYAGVKGFVAVFFAGHLDHIDEKAEQPCAGATYTPFPELEQLPR